MNISMKWLSEYVETTPDIAAFCDKMTMTGTKVERAETSGEEIQRVVLGRILSVEAHPDADKLVVTQVAVGSETIQVVTGAKNIVAGDYVPVALDGASLAGGVKIKSGKLRGVVNCGLADKPNAFVFALEMRPTLLQINNVYGRFENEGEAGGDPMIAYVHAEQIAIEPLSHSLSKNLEL